MKWQEEKHPRDEDGKFTEKGTGKQFRQNASYGEILKADNKVTLTKQEWANYYKTIGEIKAGLLAKRYSQSGRHYIIIGSKVIFDNDNFENPRVYEVVKFKSEDALFDWLDAIGEL